MQDLVKDAANRAMFTENVKLWPIRPLWLAENFAAPLEVNHDETCRVFGIP